MSQPDLPTEVADAYETIFEDYMAFERHRRDQLFAVARIMTDLGMPGEDPEDPKVRNFLDHALTVTTTDDELRAYILKNWRTGK